MTLAYRGDAFNRVKPKNRERLEAARAARRVDVRLRTEVARIFPDRVELDRAKERRLVVDNDAVIVQAGRRPADRAAAGDRRHRRDEVRHGLGRRSGWLSRLHWRARLRGSPASARRASGPRFAVPHLRPDFEPVRMGVPLVPAARIGRANIVGKFPTNFLAMQASFMTFSYFVCNLRSVAFCNRTHEQSYDS